jgi:exodeoxyribonuclease-3
MMKVATFNANSIRMRRELVSAWLKKESPDVLGVQETKVQDSEFPVDAFADTGYRVVFRGQKGYAGVALFSREEPRDVGFGFDGGEAGDEARLIHAVVGGIAIVNTYVPQGQSLDAPEFEHKLQFFRDLRAFFERNYTPRNRLLWMGDLNVAPEEIDVHDPKRLKKHVDFHPEVRAAAAYVKEWGFVDLFRLHHPDEPGQYTFWDYRQKGSLEKNQGWRVDHIWATKPLAKKCTKCWIDVDARRGDKPSDHTFVVAEFDL